MLVNFLLKARAGDGSAAEEIVAHYTGFIEFIMSKYEIDNRNDCYDCTVERILSAIYKFKL